MSKHPSFVRICIWTTAVMALAGCDARTSAVRGLKFADPVLKARWRAVDGRAETLRDEPWAHDNYTKDEVLPFAWRVHWSTAVDSKGRPTSKRAKAAETLQLVELAVDRDSPDSDLLTYLYLTAIFLPAHRPPANPPWQAQVTYRVFHREDGLFARYQLSFDNRSSLEFADDPALQLGESSYRGRRTFGELQYEVSGTSPGIARMEIGECDAELRRCLSSPDGFRDSALAELDMLMEDIEDGIAQRISVKKYHGQGEFRDEQGKFDRPEYEQHPLTDYQKALLLEDAKAEINRRWTIVVSHYEELHAAAVKAFPIHDCLVSE